MEVLKECCRFKIGTCVAEFNPQPLENFCKDRKRIDNLTVHCKSCLKAIRASKDKEKMNEYGREWRKRNIEKCKIYDKIKNSKPNAIFSRKKYRLKCRYGITTEQWERMHEEQNWCCAICLSHMNNCVEKELHVDHCHKTGKVRGLLCSTCNKMLGLAKEDFSILDRSIKYLKRGSVDVQQS